MSKFKILSIDGGGIRGIIPATILAEIEKRAGKPISSLFNLLAGTSTGGILALGLVRPKPGQPDKPAYSASEGVSFYEENGSQVFARDVWHRLHAAGNLAEERYPSAGVESVLAKFFGETRLKEALTDVLIPAYDIERRVAYFFKSRKARLDAADDFTMRHAARATSAAPTFFEPVKIEQAGSSDYYAMVDGGIHSNNPAMCAYAEAKAHYKDTDPIIVVSLGTGQMTRPYLYEKVKTWGLIGWAQPLLDLIFDGMLGTVDYQLRQLLPDGVNVKHYYRFQAMLDQDSGDIDDTQSKTVRRLKLLAEDIIRERDRELDALCKQLV